MPLKPNPSDLGFTLTETLVVLALIAIITSFAFGGLSFGVRTWEKGTTVGEHTTRFNRSASLVGNLIEQAYPLPVAASNQTHVSFTGDTDSLTFLTLLEGPGETGGHQRVTIRHQDGRLVLIRNGSPNGMDEHTTNLLENVKRLELAYYGALRPGHPPAWHDRWREARTLPDLVRLRIEPDIKTSWWPDLIVEPKIESDARCVFNPISNDCVYK